MAVSLRMMSGGPVLAVLSPSVTFWVTLKNPSTTESCAKSPSLELGIGCGDINILPSISK